MRAPAVQGARANSLPPPLAGCVAASTRAAAGQPAHVEATNPDDVLLRFLHPQAPRTDPESAGALITFVLGAASSLAGAVGVGIPLLLVGGTRGVLAFRRHRLASAQRHDAIPQLQLFPRVRTTSIVETLSGHVTLNPDQDYLATTTSAAGLLTAEMTFGPADVQQVRRHRAKHKLESDDLPFSAGAIVLRGQIGADFSEDDAHRMRGNQVVVLQDRTTAHPSLQGRGGRDRGRWTVELPYDIRPQPGEESWDVPVWLTPGLVPESGRRALDLELQWRKFGPGDSELVLDQVELLLVRVPAKWGSIESASPSATIGQEKGTSGSFRTIEWKQLQPDSARGRRIHLSVRFENTIDDVEEVITGWFDVSFTGALSGIEGVTAFDATGTPGRVSNAQQPKTRIHVDFELSLASLRYQEVLSVSPGGDEGGVEFDDVIPDHITVAHLTDRLSQAGYYVKRVIENPSRSSRRANIINRVWDIAGRHYDGIYPIDFHLTLTGEEEHDGQPRAFRGQTRAKLVVHGAYANDDMRDNIDAAYESLNRRIRRALRRDLDAEAPPSDGADRHDERIDTLGYRMKKADVAVRSFRQHLEFLTGQDRLAPDVHTELDAKIEAEILPLLDDNGPEECR